MSDTRPYRVTLENYAATTVDALSPLAAIEAAIEAQYPGARRALRGGHGRRAAHADAVLDLGGHLTTVRAEAVDLDSITAPAHVVETGRRRFVTA